jgi:uncharacterized RmlC-like cupin family protein
VKSVLRKLWPASFDSEGNKTDWRYNSQLEEYHSAATGDFMYAVPGDPTAAEQADWLSAHPDAIRTQKP